MVKKRDPICTTLQAVQHQTTQNSDKESIFKVKLESPESDPSVKVTISSTDREIFKKIPLKSERQISLDDHQTTLSSEKDTEETDE